MRRKAIYFTEEFFYVGRLDALMGQKLCEKPSQSNSVIPLTCLHICKSSAYVYKMKHEMSKEAKDKGKI